MPRYYSWATSLEHTYNNYGDKRPSRYFLEKTHKRISKSGERGLLLTAAHMSIDLAFADPSNAAHHLRQSQEHLDDIVETAEAYAQYTGSAVCRSQIAATAVMHATDIPNWIRATRSEPPIQDYTGRLKAADDALCFAQDDPQAEERVLEFIPILLGERGIVRGTRGWTGRLALNRENCRTPEHRSINPNWDTGICFPETEHTFINPFRVQIKRKPHGGVGRSAQSYTRAGVAVVYANQAGFNNAFQVVDSCWNEIEPVLNHQDLDVPLLTSEELNDITERIYRQATEPRQQ